MAYMIPPKLYVGFKSVPLRGWKDGEYQTLGKIKQGMLVPDGDDSGAKNRKSSVKSFNKDSKFSPEVWTNDPIEGFQINVKAVQYGYGNNWVVEDPRGGNFEISPENVARILNQTTVIGGLIEGKCAWLRDGTVNKLVLEGSREYQKAFGQTIARMNRVSLRDVKRGDEVLLHEGNKATYLGLFRVARINKNYYRDNNYPEHVKEIGEVVKRYLYLIHDEDQNGKPIKQLAAKSSVKVGHIEKEINEELTKEESFNLAKKAFHNYHDRDPYNNDSFDSSFVFFAPQPFAIDDLQLDIVPLENKNLHFNELLVTDEKNSQFDSYLHKVERKVSPQSLVTCFCVDVDLLKEKTIQRDVEHNHSGWSTRSSFREKEIKYADYTWNKVKLSVKDTPYEKFFRIVYL